MIPREAHADTPLFLLATAGMRLLPDLQRNRLLDEICSYARHTTPFLLPECDLHVRVIAGETEGLYGWITANYLLGGFDHPEMHAHGGGHHTYGFLDMGGASAQIAFVPNATETEKHAQDLVLLKMRNLNGNPIDYKVFVTTWLGFGVNQARSRYVHALVDASSGDGVTELPDPCLPRGLRSTLKGEEIQAGTEANGVHLIGTGLFGECLSQTYPLLEKDQTPCKETSCLLQGAHTPAIDFDVNHFVGVSEYWYTTHEIFGSDHDTKSYDFGTYQQRVKEFCSQDWSAIEELVAKKQWGKNVDEEKAMQTCFKASWLINVLHSGIGIPRVGNSAHNETEETEKSRGFLDPFQPVDKIADVEVSWTLGKMVLYAASQISPPEGSGNAVGFGTNVIGDNGLPIDFEYAASQRRPSRRPTPGAPGGSNHSMGSDQPHWHDSLWREGDKTPRRIPGLLLFMLIFILAGFLLMGRERRGKLWRVVMVSGKRGKRKILGSGGGVTYERVMEEGHDQFTDFELGSVSSSSSSDDEAGSWSKHSLYDPPIGSGALRSGMGTRIGSRERLPTISRAGDISPTRGGSIARARSPLPPR